MSEMGKLVSDMGKLGSEVGKLVSYDPKSLSKMGKLGHKRVNCCQN